MGPRICSNTGRTDLLGESSFGFRVSGSKILHYRSVKLIELWAENPEQWIEDVFAVILNSVLNTLVRR